MLDVQKCIHKHIFKKTQNAGWMHRTFFMFWGHYCPHLGYSFYDGIIECFNDDREAAGEIARKSL